MILLEHVGNKLHKEEQVVYDFWKPKNSWDIVKLCKKDFDRNRFVIHPQTVILVVGSIDFVHAALRQMNRPIPANDCYPACIRPFLNRKVWEGTLRDFHDDYGKVFIKPRNNLKKFTGRVFYSPDSYPLQHIGKNTPVYFSEVVEWKSEWRYYIGNNFWQVETDCYEGDPNVRPDPEVLKHIFTAMKAANLHTPNVIDIGVLSTGETAVIEVNDAYSVGYLPGIRPIHYQAMLSLRWQKMSGYRIEESDWHSDMSSLGNLLKV